MAAEDKTAVVVQLFRELSALEQMQVLEELGIEYCPYCGVVLLSGRRCVCMLSGHAV